MFDPDDHPPAVDITDFEAHRLGRPQPRRISRRQRGTRLQACHCLEKPHHLVGAQHHRQLARLPSVRDTLGNIVMTERDAIEEPQSADRLVEGRPRDTGRDQMDLEGAHLLQSQPLRRASEIPAELRHCMHV